MPMRFTGVWVCVTAPDVGHFQAQDHVGVSHRARAVERMRGGEIHAEVAIDDRGLQRLGQFDSSRCLPECAPRGRRR